MSLPSISEQEATPRQVQEMLHRGVKLYYVDAKVFYNGEKYCVEVADVPEASRYFETLEALAYFIAFAGVEHT